MTYTPYAYAILRYVDDVVAQEFLNLGVVVLSSDRKECRVRFPSSFLRVRMTFPNVDVLQLRKELAHLQTKIEAFAANGNKALTELMAVVLPPDGSSLQWSPTALGITDSLDRAADDLLSRFVTRCTQEYEYLPTAAIEQSWTPAMKFRMAVNQSPPWEFDKVA